MNFERDGFGEIPHAERTQQARNFAQHVRLRNFFHNCAAVIGMPTPDDEAFVNSFGATLKDKIPTPPWRSDDSTPPSTSN
jgi:hypothetical protein